MKFNYFYGLVLILAGLQLPANEPPAPSLRQARETLERLDSRLSNLKRFGYRVQLDSRMGSEKATRSFRFLHEAPGKVHIHHTKPDEREIYLVEDELIEYLPSARRALRTDLTKLDPQDKQALLVNVMSRSVVDGLRLGNVEEILPRLTGVEARQTEEGTLWVLQGEDPEFYLRIDPEKLVLLESRIHDQEGLLFTSKSSAFKEVVPGVWFPSEIRNQYRTPRGMVENRLRLDQIQVNHSLEPGRFQFSLPRGAQWHQP